MKHVLIIIGLAVAAVAACVWLNPNLAATARTQINRIRTGGATRDQYGSVLGPVIAGGSTHAPVPPPVPAANEVPTTISKAVAQTNASPSTTTTNWEQQAADHYAQLLKEILEARGK
jgi:hypothetical protein